MDEAKCGLAFTHEEVAALRRGAVGHRLDVLRRQRPSRMRVSTFDRFQLPIISTAGVGQDYA